MPPPYYYGQPLPPSALPSSLRSSSILGPYKLDKPPLPGPSRLATHSYKQSRPGNTVTLNPPSSRPIVVSGDTTLNSPSSRSIVVTGDTSFSSSRHGNTANAPILPPP
ncbi:hypothetical protein CIB48_g4010 [Xylaria polymorpha]|nr:hypothetical protein CIB48_g4010 [Xylaria polymorpha]